MCRVCRVSCATQETQPVRVKVVNIEYDRDRRYLPNRILNYCWHTKSALSHHDGTVVTHMNSPC